MIPIKPPPAQFEAPLVHKFFEFYKQFYRLGRQIPKRDYFGIYSTAEKLCLEIMQLIIAASLETKPNKLALLTNARIKIETLKKFIRAMEELKIVTIKSYLSLESILQEISKMTSGWIKYLINSK